MLNTLTGTSTVTHLARDLAIRRQPIDPKPFSSGTRVASRVHPETRTRTRSAIVGECTASHLHRPVFNILSRRPCYAIASAAVCSFILLLPQRYCLPISRVSLAFSRLGLSIQNIRSLLLPPSSSSLPVRLQFAATARSRNLNRNFHLNSANHHSKSPRTSRGS